MTDEYFYNADGEMLVVPEIGALRFFTEFGIIDIAPGEIAVLPRGVKFQVSLRGDPRARGYVCENYGAKFTCPERGPIGANCLANRRDFLTPVAAFEEKDGVRCRLVVKWCGAFQACEIPTFAARRRRLARQLRALQIQSSPLRAGRADPARTMPTRRSSAC